MEDPIATAEYSFNNAMAAPWVTQSYEDVPLGAHASDGLLQGNWEEWLRWDPMSQNQSPNFIKTQGAVCHSRLEQRPPLPAQRQNSRLGEQAFGLPTTVPSAPLMTVSTTAAYTFGESTGNPPAFHFGATTLSSSTSMEMPPSKPTFNDTIWSDNNQQHSSEASVFSPLPAEQQQHSRHVPLPPQSTPSLQHSPGSTRNTRTSSSSSQSSNEPFSRQRNNKKRKSSTEDEIVDDKGDHPPPMKKTAHNMIEKRYRTNLNDKIAALRDSVPSLRAISQRSGNAEEEEDGEDLEGLTPAHKLNKATVLSKATEYIRHLEKRYKRAMDDNKRLMDELAATKARVDSYNKLAMAGAVAMTSSVTTPDPIRFQEDPFAGAATPGLPVTQGAPQGMIPVPENIQSLHRATVNQPHYAQQQHGYPLYATAPARPMMAGQQPMVHGRMSSGFMSKLMVGSLAGLMIMEGFTEQEQSGEQPEGRGLFGVPVHLLNRLASSWTHRLPALSSSSTQPILPILKVFLIFGALVYIMLPLFEFKPKAKKRTAQAIRLTPAPSLASPVEVRRKAWLTAIQTVWVPQHTFVLEAAALCLKTLKLSTRKLVSWHGYALLTGTTKEQEAARVKAWEIALDAQLTGGDAEISLSRLILTLMASGTLPDTPARLMLKALHIRVLLWEAAKAGYGTWYMFDEISAKLARSYWNAARNEHKMLSNSPARGSAGQDPLPDHLAALLEMESDDVLVDSIVQRAYNLAWNKPSAENTEADAIMDSVVEDFAISSPLDALAAWWSSLLKRRAMVRYLDSAGSAPVEVVKAELDTAIRTAPPTSRSQIRALVARAVLLDDEREANIAAAAQALPSEPTASAPQSDAATRTVLVNMIRRAPVSEDVQVALTLAKCLSLAEKHGTDEMRKAATSVINDYYIGANNFTLLSFVAAYRVLDVFSENANLLAGTKQGLERMASSMRIWIGREVGRKTGVHNRTRARIVEHCLRISKMLVGITDTADDGDAGYVSQSEDERDAERP